MIKYFSEVKVGEEFIHYTGNRMKKISTTHAETIATIPEVKQTYLLLNNFEVVVEDKKELSYGRK